MSGGHSASIRRLAIGIAGVIYLGCVLLWNVSMPAFGVIVIGLAGYDLVESHWPKRR